MTNKKSILDTIHPPMPASTKSEVTSSEVDLAGEITSLVIKAGEYHSFDIINATLVDFSALNVTCYRASLLRCSFTRAQLTGLQLPGSHIKDTLFRGCRVNLSNFRNAVFERCLFTDCDLREADFSGAQFTNVRFENCEMAGAEFSNTRCKNAEFDTTNLSGIRGVRGLGGAVITEQNLIEIGPLLARELDIALENTEAQ